MKVFYFLLISMSLYSFCPSTEKAVSESKVGFYIHVKDHTDRTFHKFVVDSRDSVDVIFEQFFNTELELGEIDYPLSIYNGKRDFYIARVTVHTKQNGELGFKNLKYPKVYNKAIKKRNQLKPVML